MGLDTELCRLLRGGLLKRGQLFGEGGVGDYRGLRLTLEHALGLVQGFVDSNRLLIDDKVVMAIVEAAEDLKLLLVVRGQFAAITSTIVSDDLLDLFGVGRAFSRSTALSLRRLSRFIRSHY